MIWPFNKIKKLKLEIVELRRTINNLEEIQQRYYSENQVLRKHLVDAANILKKKEDDYNATIAFMKLQNLSNKK
jgi:hypothetical protein